MAPRRHVIKSSKSKPRGEQELLARHILARLPSLFSKTQGRAFGTQAFRDWIRSERAFQKCKLPSVQAVARILGALVQPELQTSTPGSSRKTAEPASSRNNDLSRLIQERRRIWQRTGLHWIDPEGEASVGNIRGSSLRRRGASTWASWREYGYIFQLCKVKATTRVSFVVTRANAYKSLGSVVTKAAKREALFRNIVTLDPHRCDVGRVTPQWTLIYLHSFSNKGTDYLDYPHYFGISEAAVRVVIPTAPLLEQACFKDWYVWKGSKMKWRRIKFSAWFDYLTDHGGKAENDIDLDSLLAMRANLHALIKEEVRRLGGDSRRVLIGGASQGCCVALDAALTYPEELGGVIGVVGHLLRSTPTNTPHKSMPLHLFHEANDGEMKWRWVKGTVARLRRSGFSVTSKREEDPSGSGHWIQEIEGKWICSALRQIVTR